MPLMELETADYQLSLLYNHCNKPEFLEYTLKDLQITEKT